MRDNRIARRSLAALILSLTMVPGLAFARTAGDHAAAAGSVIRGQQVCPMRAAMALPIRPPTPNSGCGPVSPTL